MRSLLIGHCLFSASHQFTSRQKAEAEAECEDEGKPPMKSKGLST